MTFPIKLKGYKELVLLQSQLIKVNCPKCRGYTFHLIQGYNGRLKCMRCKE